MDKPLSVKSSRGKRVLSRALYIGIKKLSKEVEVFTKDEQAKKDLRDMQDLYNNMYDSYIPPQDWGELLQALDNCPSLTITEHLYKQGGI